MAHLIVKLGVPCEENEEAVGSTSQDFLNGSSGLLFTVLLAHYSLRESLDVSEIVYMEYFYFFMYIVIFLLLVLNHLKSMNINRHIVVLITILSNYHLRMTGSNE